MQIFREKKVALFIEATSNGMDFTIQIGNREFQGTIDLYDCLSDIGAFPQILLDNNETGAVDALKATEENEGKVDL